MKNKPKYDAADIRVLTGLDAIRMRPGMYVGDIKNGSGLMNMLLEVLAYSIEEFKNNQCTKLSILIRKNHKIVIKNNGAGLPVETRGEKSYIERLMTEVTQFNFGLAIVNALSSKVKITIARDGVKWVQKYKKGKPKSLKKIGKVNYSGTTIDFLPDRKYFPNLYFNQTQLIKRLNELSYLHKGLYIDFEDRSNCKAHFHNPNGLVDLAIELLPKINNWKTKVPPLQLRDETPDFKLNAVIVFAEDCCNVSFVNEHKTTDGGTHQQGLIAGIAQVLKIVSGCKNSADMWKSIIQNELISVLSVNFSVPQWAGSTKDKLISESAYIKTKSLVVNNLLKLMNENKTLEYEFKKLYVDKYLMMDYKKNHDKYGLPTPQYAKEKLIELFNNPKEYDYLIQQYVKFDLLFEKCLKQQEFDCKK
jgi:DNA gyrase/topoisomerase IV subunit B